LKITSRVAPLSATIGIPNVKTLHLQSEGYLLPDNQPNLPDTVRHQNDVSGLQGNVTASRTRSDTDVRTGWSFSVIQASSDHPH
jgi:hypothetical protein